MKKFLSLILAAILLMSCTAFAGEVPGGEGGSAPANKNENMTEEYVGPEIGTKANNFEQVDSASNFSGHDSASQRTDVWLQVEASGQIDVTVPLVAVFKTNIDGGSATISDEYVITNNSTAALKVTKVVIEDQMYNVTTNGNESNMTMVTSFDKTKDVDKYTLQMLPEDHYASKKWPALVDVTTFTKTASEDTTTYTKDSKVNESYVEVPGLWRIERAGLDDHASYVQLDLATSPLTFVTEVKSKDDAEIENGIKLFTITYTVMIDDSTAVGDDIAGTALNGETYSYTGE